MLISRFIKFSLKGRLSKKTYCFSTKNSLPEEKKVDLPTSESGSLSERTQQTALQLRTLEELELPYNIFGNHIEIPPKSKFIASQIMIRTKVSEKTLWDHFTKILQGTVYSMVAQDEEFLNEYVEATFAKAILGRTQGLLKNGYKIEVYEDVNGYYGEPIGKMCNIMDMVMVRGVSANRAENLPENQYHKYIDNEDMGLVVYTPLEITDPKQFIDPEKNKTMYDSYKKAVMRVLAEIKSNLRLKIIRPNGEEIVVPQEEYSWKHLCVFETQMKPVSPLKSSYKLENYMEWLTKFNFGVWKLADLDNFMLGNPLIPTQKKIELYADDIFKGTKYDPKVKVDLRNI